MYLLESRATKCFSSRPMGEAKAKALMCFGLTSKVTDQWNDRIKSESNKIWFNIKFMGKINLLYQTHSSAWAVFYHKHFSKCTSCNKSLGC